MKPESAAIYTWTTKGLNVKRAHVEPEGVEVQLDPREGTQLIDVPPLSIHFM